MDFFFDDVDCLSDIYTLESYHYSIVKDNLRLEHMKAMHESVEIVTEAFSDMIQKMGEWFRKLIQMIKDFFKKVIMFIASYTMDIDKFCKKYKKELTSIDKVNFTVQGYKFELDTKPDLTELRNIVTSYNDGISDINKLNKNDIKIEQTDYLSDDNLNKLRGKILGTKTKIDDGDFSNEVRKYYHGGEIDSIDIEVDGSMFRDVVNGAPKLAASKKDAEKLRDDTIALLARAEKFFGRDLETVYKNDEKQYKVDSLKYNEGEGKLSTGDTTHVSSSKREVLETFIKFKYNQTREVSAIANVVVREYANAFKDKVKMHREILRKSLFDKNTDSDTASTKADD